MTKKQVLTPLLLLVAALAIAIGLIKFPTTQQHTQAHPQPPRVNTLIVHLEDVTPVIESQGRTTADTTQLISEVSGSVISLSSRFVSGGVFKQGDELLTIEPLNYQLQRAQAQATRFSAQTRLLEEQARAKTEKDNWLKSGKALSQAPALLIRTPYVNQAKAVFEAATFEVEKADMLLARTTVRAPYDGLVSRKEVGLGQHVSVGSPLGRVFSSQYGEVRLALSARQLSLLETPTFGALQSLDASPALL